MLLHRPLHPPQPPHPSPPAPQPAPPVGGGNSVTQRGPSQEAAVHHQQHQHHPTQQAQGGEPLSQHLTAQPDGPIQGERPRPILGHPVQRPQGDVDPTSHAVFQRVSLTEGTSHALPGGAGQQHRGFGPRRQQDACPPQAAVPAENHAAQDQEVLSAPAPAGARGAPKLQPRQAAPVATRYL